MGLRSQTIWVQFLTALLTSCVTLDRLLLCAFVMMMLMLRVLNKFIHKAFTTVRGDCYYYYPSSLLSNTRPRPSAPLSQHFQKETTGTLIAGEGGGSSLHILHKSDLKRLPSGIWGPPELGTGVWGAPS